MRSLQLCLLGLFLVACSGKKLPSPMDGQLTRLTYSAFRLTNTSQISCYFLSHWQVAALRTTKPSLHTITNAAVIQRFLPVSIQIEQENETVCRITIVPDVSKSGTMETEA